MTREERFEKIAQKMGYSFDGEMKVGGNYSPLVQHHDTIYISGQIPRVGNEIVIQGALGGEVTLEQGQLAAKICVMRAVALLKKHLGSLDKVKKVFQISVYVQSMASFTQQSEVSDGASEVLHEIFGEAGIHSRTSVGVFQLPKNAPVEIAFVVAVE
jgi:enamine deaminase RidA (YjgF/YER057c/UK114 family)